MQAPYLDCVHGISLGHYYGKRPCQPHAALVSPQFHVCTSLTPRPITVFGLRTRVLVRTRTFENGVLCNGQQPGSAVNSFICSYENVEWS